MSRFKLLAFLAFVLLVSVPSGTAQAQTPASVNVSQNAEYGDILVDANGMTLYLFTNDERDKSNCAGGCATAWPPLVTVGDPTAGEGVTGDKLGTITRDDGYTQVTYNGWPLYYFAPDEKPGDTKGQNVGDVWFVVDTAGQAVRPATSEPPSVGDTAIPVMARIGLIVSLLLITTGGLILVRVRTSARRA